MADPGSDSEIERILAGWELDPGAVRGALLDRGRERLVKIARRMLRGDFARIGRFEEVDDIVQNASIRLLRTLEDTRPATLIEFLKLSTLAIRRELLDLARHYYGPHGAGVHQVGQSPQGSSDGSPLDGGADSTYDPSRLALWAEFHKRVEGLPDDQRLVFELRWYQGLTHEETAAVLGVSSRTVKRHWFKAQESLGPYIPGRRASGDPS